MFVFVLFLSSGVVYGEDVPVAAISTGVDNLDVNLYEGDFTFSIPLGSIPGRNGMGFGVNLNYVSDVYKIVNKDNSKAQASEVGLGFNLGGEYYVYRDPGATINDMSDDYLYMNLPGLGSNRLVKVYENVVNPGDEWYREYKTEEDTYAKIEEWFNSDFMEHAAFKVTTVDGTEYLFTHQRNTVAFNYDSEYEPYIVSDNAMNFFQAQDWCNAQGGSLACPNTLSKDEQIRVILGSNRWGWLGLYDSNGDGCWNDVCALDTYSNWYEEYGEPDSECQEGTDDNPFVYVHSNGGENGHWVDTNNPNAISTHAVCNAGIGGREAPDKIEFVYQWDLELIRDVNGNEIDFNYGDVIFEVDGSPYTKSYLESITDDMGTMINIVWSANREDVYYGNIVNGEDPANAVKDKYVTDVITTSGLGDTVSSWHFDYDYVNDNEQGNDNENKKLILTSLTYQGDGSGSLPPYVFGYTEEGDIPGVGYVDEVLYPTGSRASLAYELKEIMGMITFVGDPGWNEIFEDTGDRGVGDNYCDRIDYSPEDCINSGCYWKNSVEKCEMDEVAITGFRVKSKSVDDGLGTVEDVTYTYENALLHLEKKRQKYIGHDKVTIDYPAGFGSTVKEFCNNRGSECADEIGCDEVSSAKLDRFMYSSKTFNEEGSETVASSGLDICPVVTYLPADTDPLDIIENPDFQDWAGGIPNGWTKVKSTSPYCSDYNLNEFILEDGNGYVKMRTPRYFPDCFYLKQTIDVEIDEPYYMTGFARIKDEGYGYPNYDWKIEVYDGDEEIGSRRGGDEDWHEFYMYNLISSSGTMEIRMFPQPSDIDGTDFDVWNAYNDLKIFNSAGGGDPDGVTYDLRVSSQNSMVNGISTGVEYSNYNEVNGLPHYVVENGEKVSTTRFAFQEYPQMEDENMLSQVYWTSANDFDGNYRLSKTTWSDSSGVWRPYRNYAGQLGEEYFISKVNSYDSYGNVLEVEDAKGHTTKMYYGDNGMCDNEGEAFKHSLLTCAVDTADNEVRTWYTNTLNLQKVVDVNGGETSYSYDNFNRLYEVNSPDGGRTTNTYNYAMDQCGYLSEEEGCLNSVSSEVVMNDGMTMNSVAYSDGLARGIQIRILKDSENALVSDIDYNEISKVSKITEPRSEQIGGFRGIVYPLLGGFGDDLSKDYLLGYREGEGDGESVRNFYYDDPIGRVEKVFPLTLYDEGDEFSEDCLSAGCNKYTYDGSGTTTITDLEGNQLSSTVDSFGNIVGVQDEVSSIGYDYDVFGQLHSVSGSGQETFNEYNTLGQLIWTYNVDSGEKSFTYDENGNLVKTFVYLQPDGVFGNEESQGSSREFTNHYDNLDRVDYITRMAMGQESTLLDNAYDNCENGVGRLCEVYNHIFDNSISYEYDTMGRVTSITENIEEGFSATSSYIYDLAGNLVDVSVTYNGETSSTEYIYNNLGQLINVIVDGSDVMYEYDDLGMIDYVTYPNNIVSDYAYNDRNWISGIHVIQDEELTLFNEVYDEYDEVGNLESINDLYNGGSASFNYDGAYRLTDFSGDYYGVGNVHYDIDSSGNRELRTVSQQNDLIDTVDYEYNGNKLTSIDIGDDGDNDCTFVYDESFGGVRSKTCGDETTTYNYNSLDQLYNLHLISGDETQWTLGFEYDALGRRVKKSYNLDDSITYYFYGLGISPLIEHKIGGDAGSCGDGNIDFDEECDDGNSNNNDDCTNECENAICGDGIIWGDGSGTERCDGEIGCPTGKWCSVDCQACLKDGPLHDISEVLHGDEVPL